MRLVISLGIVLLFFSCNNSNNPDVSKISINISTKRFEKELFAIDSNQFQQQLSQVLSHYPAFGPNFLSTILNADTKWGADTTKEYVNGFIASYKNIYDTAEKIFSDFTFYENEIKKGLQYLKYYFPNYHTPQQIVTYIGPLDGYGDILTDDAFVIGLQHHLGAKASFYNSSWLHETYTDYITNRFEPNTISVNCMSNLVLDMYPEKKDDATLATQMIEKGKRLFLLSKLLPDAAPHLLIGYTDTQLKNCYKHEANIWELFIQNDLLQTIDNNLIKNYIGESPKTQELGEESPGNIGAFVGWQIVKKYMGKNATVSLIELMSTNPETILEKAKYKP